MPYCDLICKIAPWLDIHFKWVQTIIAVGTVFIAALSFFLAWRSVRDQKESRRPWVGISKITKTDDKLILTQKNYGKSPAIITIVTFSVKDDNFEREMANLGDNESVLFPDHELNWEFEIIKHTNLSKYDLQLETTYKSSTGKTYKSTNTLTESSDPRTLSYKKITAT